MKKIGFATCRDIPHLTEDDLLVIRELWTLGIETVPVIWDQDLACEGLSAVILRSCWDYHLRPHVFVEWVEKMHSNSIRIFNSGPTIKWNLDKHYLEDLTNQGVKIPQTIWVEAGTDTNLKKLLERHAIQNAVIKPVISMSAYETWQTSLSQADAHQQLFSRAIAHRNVMVQSLVPEVMTKGEISFVFLGGKYSHAVCKKPKEGDFRVQVDFGGTREKFEPSSVLLGQAQKVVRCIQDPLLYARVDGIDVNGQLMLMELELIDPVLFLAYHPLAPQRFAKAIAASVII